MKLATLILALMVAVPSFARADILNPPSGPVEDDGQGDVDMIEARNPGGPMRGPGMREGGRRQRDPQQVAKRQRLRRALLEQFDANGDGRLGPRERMRAARVLRRIETKLTQPMQRQNRAGQYRRFMSRYDVNRDGQVGPREVPQGAADRLRRFDRNGDGWVEQNELP